MPTLKQLYHQHTGDTTAHQTRIAAAYRQLDPRRQRWIDCLIDGVSLRGIAQAERLSPGTVLDGIRRAFDVMHKRVNGQPCYAVDRPNAQGPRRRHRR